LTRLDHTVGNWQKGNIINISPDEFQSNSLIRLLDSPFEFSQAFDRALKNVVGTLPDRPKTETAHDVMYYCAYIGNFGALACNPRTLNSAHLNHMVSLEGITTKCSLVRPKVIKSVHYCERKSTFHFKEYRDQTMTASGPASSSIYPTDDGEGNPVRMIPYQFWKYKD